MDGQQQTPPKSKEPDDYEAASQATASDTYEDYEKRKSFSYSVPTHRGRKTVVVVILVLILLGGVGYGAYWFLTKKDSNKSADKSPSNSQQSTDDQSADEELITTETEHYTSNSFMLEFDYPKDWKVSETDGGLLTGKSPAIALKQADGKSVTGQVIFTIRNKQQEMPEFDKGNATAVLASEKINYTKPSSAQRGSTYLSFLTYAGSAQANRLDGVFITGDVGYQKGQAIPKADFTPVDPVISVTFMKCADQACADEGTQIGIDAAMWQKTGFGTAIKSMLQSLVIN
jgi:hypothetical protein